MNLFVLCMIYSYGNRGYYQDGKLIVYNNFVKSEYTKDDFYKVEISDEEDGYDHVDFYLSDDDLDYISISEDSIVWENEFGALVKAHGGVPNKKKIKLLGNLKRVFSDKVKK